MLRVSKNFRNSSGYVCQTLDHERVLETRPEARQALQDVLIEASKTFKGITPIMGPDKDIEVAHRKAVRDYNGDDSRVSDFVRAKAEVRYAQAITDFKSDEFQELLNSRGIEIAGMNDFFSDPKEKTGYRCLNFKLAVPVDGSPKSAYDYQDVEKQVVELQVVAEQIECKYNETHPYKRTAERLEDQIFQYEREQGITELKEQRRKAKRGDAEPLTEQQATRLKLFRNTVQPLKKLVAENYAMCRLINGSAAQSDDPDYDYESLLDDQLKSKHALTPQTRQKLELMTFDLVHGGLDI